MRHSFAGPSSAIRFTVPSLSQTRPTNGPSARSPRFTRQAPRTIFLLALGIYVVACASGPGSGSTTPPPPPPPPPPPQITITIAPDSGTVLLGNTLPFSASDTNTSDTSVFWSVNGMAGGTGIFGAHVVAVDAASGAVVAGTLGGWSCQAPGPAKFDGTYQIGALAVNRTYKIYVQPLNGAVGPAEVSNVLVSLCRNTTNDPGWPRFHPASSPIPPSKSPPPPARHPRRRTP